MKANSYHEGKYLLDDFIAVDVNKLIFAREKCGLHRLPGARRSKKNDPRCMGGGVVALLRCEICEGL